MEEAAKNIDRTWNKGKFLVWKLQGKAAISSFLLWGGGGGLLKAHYCMEDLRYRITVALPRVTGPESNRGLTLQQVGVLTA
jgi:hypothetical protein